MRQEGKNSGFFVKFSRLRYAGCQSDKTTIGQGLRGFPRRKILAGDGLLDWKHVVY